MSLRILPDLEQWRTIPRISDDYEVSSLGRLRSYRTHGGKRREETPHLLTIKPGYHGYLVCGLQLEKGKRRRFTVHELVARAFIGPRPPGYQVAHNDGDRTNSRADNLRYATPLENAEDKHRHGTMCKGETNGNRRLTEAQVREIFARYQAGEQQIPLAEAFGISQSQVSNIVLGRAWAHLGLVGVA